MFHTKVVQKIKEQVLCSMTSPPQKSDMYEIMWKNTVEPERSQMTIWRMRIPCRIPEFTNTHSEYVISIALPLQQQLYERVSMLRCTYTVRVVHVFILHTNTQGYFKASELNPR